MDLNIDLTQGWIHEKRNLVSLFYDSPGPVTSSRPSNVPKNSITIKGTNIISNYFFKDLSGVRKIILPETITKIETGAFYECYALREINIPNGVIEIKDSAFYKCYSLPKIMLPETITKIGW
jgi:hypothetical protein